MTLTNKEVGRLNRLKERCQVLAERLKGQLSEGHKTEIRMEWSALSWAIERIENPPQYVSQSPKAIGECEECGHKIVTPLTPLPVAWRWRRTTGMTGKFWAYSDERPTMPGVGDCQVEPLFSSPSISPRSKTDG